METGDESLEIRTFATIPSAADFKSRIELRNVPAVFRGCLKDWEAYSKWNPSNGGLDYLEERVGSVGVEAMLSRSAPVFYGDLRRHERVLLPFSAFIGFCKKHMHNKEGANVKSDDSVASEDAVPEQIYLAQVPIMNAEKEDKVQLEILKEDIQTPKHLSTNSLASINIWMNSAYARSSTHYDPHHNLLCVVAGCKQVILWPPSASPMLYPMPIYGESSNHSSVALEKPNLSVYPRAEGAMEYSQKVILQAGDALFIPEGWFHQVDSDDLTIAVNFWWRSDVLSNLSEHMDSYYLRRIIRRLTEREMNLILPKPSSTVSKRLKEYVHDKSRNVEAECFRHNSNQESDEEKLGVTELQQKTLLREMEPFALQALHKLVSLVHDRVNVADLSQRIQCPSRSSSERAADNENNMTLRTISLRLEDDPAAEILWTLEPSMLQSVLLAMARNFPRTLEALILHLLSPVTAEVLAQKFDEMDQQCSEEDRNKFYQEFYGAFDDQSAAMDAILSGKELFAFQAFKNVLDKYVGVNMDFDKTIS